MNIVIDGFGSIGRRHYANLLRTGDHYYFIKRRIDDGSLSQEKQLQVITSLDEVSTIRIDAIFICSPTSNHIENLKWANEHHVHVFMEKPLTYRIDFLEAAQKSMQGFDQVFFIGYMLRYHPAIIQIKKIISEKTAGEIVHGRFEFGYYLPFWQPNTEFKKSYASHSEMGGGVIQTISHEADLIQYFFGLPKRIACVASNSGFLQIEAEEIADAIFDYGKFSISLHLDYLQKTYHRSIKIICTEGVIEWEWQSNVVSMKLYQQNETIYKTPIVDINDIYFQEVKEFLHQIVYHQKEHALDFAYAVSHTKLLLAMHASSKSNAFIQVYEK